ncbi:cytochrome b/b6 domain-containing protein [Hyphomicrobium sp. CS1BSMeth3]|uniref:cytochrome b/b6 domain-containing protein n=1 Tax=Hyphomicrobium sp. CS1BSMeth3 TaxID=1892844 RepID=UPI0009317CCE|nr:cytochrome b/b6 domain-containing protein [Hyphomicrobium sp. CS1BSMeth3]
MSVDQDAASRGEASERPRVRVWDGPTRLFHWSLVILIALAYATRKANPDLVWHMRIGYAILILITFRILWGFVGSSTSRFSAFAYAPWTAVRYGIDFLLRRPRHFLGHNPLGGTVVFILLGLVAAQGLLGLFSYDDHTDLHGGPLTSKVSEATVALATRWHIWLFDILLIVIALHILASFAYAIWKREDLIGPMITGRKRRKDFEDQPEAQIASPLVALLCLILAAAIVLGGITLAGGKIG